MGIPDTIEYEPGEGCEECWGEGKEFGDFLPPKYVNLTFANMIPPCDTGDGTYKAQQLDEHPCQWQYEDDVWRANWRVGAGDSELYLYNRIASEFCFHHLKLGEACQQSFVDGPATGEVT